MSKNFEVHKDFDVDEDEETWLTPHLSEKSLGNQSKPVDLKEWFGQIQTSERASLLSKKLQKYAQKRVEHVIVLLLISAARNDRMRMSVSSPLDVVTEGDGSPERNYTFSHQKLFSDSGFMTKDEEDLTEKKQVTPSQLEANESGIVNSTQNSIVSAILSPDVYTSSAMLTTSTPFADSVSRNCLPHLSPSPVQIPVAERQITSDSDEEFYDANSDFCEQEQALLSKSTLHEDPLNGNGMLPDCDSGISVVRNCMTQSLMKVEEETLKQVAQTKTSKPLRSSSVSPRPVSTAVSHSGRSQADSRDSFEHRIQTSRSTTPLSFRSTETKQQMRLSRPFTVRKPVITGRQTPAATPEIKQHHVVANTRMFNTKGQLLKNVLSSSAEISKEHDRNRNLNVTIDNFSASISGCHLSPKPQSEIPDLAALREIARKQEEVKYFAENPWIDASTQKIWNPSSFEKSNPPRKDVNTKTRIELVGDCV
ncbi:hypothetical protein DICVIV_05921 [Dictyocaulus viviparus]|uniref:Uncharacterized protein n=1 Tax=Dictyocaulus viviparus TaxID=29172 RepID=A0A0D8Y059_DICVI|nr:hypothetical protein DICVIV_05921 [Dictyocaulus viviparus]